MRVVTVAPERVGVLRERSALDSDRPSEDTLRTLRLAGLAGAWRADPDAALAALDARAAAEADPELAVALGELALLEARRRESRSPGEAAGLYLLAARSALVRVTSAADVGDALSPRFALARDLYARAAGRSVALAQALHGAPLRTHSARVLDREVTVRVERCEVCWDPGYFDRVTPVAEMRVEGLRNRHVRHGLGAALVGERANRGADERERLFPPEGILRAATAVLRFADGEARLALLDPLRASHVELAGRRFPLEADFSTPYAVLLSRAELLPLERSGLLRGSHPEDRRGVYLLEPYDADAIPVLMVHGLDSSPLTWIEATNELMGDPRLRDAYQVWHYLYPTGLPYLYSARLLRQRLAAALALLDPEGRHRASRELVILAHSMGGLLARTTVSPSGDALWRATFRVPPEELAVSPERRRWLREIFTFEPLPAVRRVVFIATPHRGSELADSLVGRVSSSLVALPDEFTEPFREVVRDNPDGITAAMRDILADGGPTSIRALSPRHPLIGVLAGLPFAPGVPVHSIVGDRGRGGGPDASDGVVPYWSAHLPDAVSELVVPADHGAHRHPAAIAEIRRILQLHLAERDARAGALR